MSKAAALAQAAIFHAKNDHTWDSFRAYIFHEWRQENIADGPLELMRHVVLALNWLETLAESTEPHARVASDAHDLLSEAMEPGIPHESQWDRIPQYRIFMSRFKFGEKPKGTQKRCHIVPDCVSRDYAERQVEDLRRDFPEYEIWYEATVTCAP